MQSATEPGQIADRQAPATYQKVGLILGPLALLLMLLPAPETMTDPAWRLTAVAIWMAIWWGTEAVPVPVTGLLPLLMFPLLGINPLPAVAAPYGHPLIFLLLGSFILALAIERWNLHKRMALKVMLTLGGTGRALIAGFMIPAWVISMLVSNTATTMMLLPVALAVIRTLQEDDTLAASEKKNFSLAVLLGIAYAASIGGIATPVGTPPNAYTVAFLQDTHGLDIGFARWFAMAGSFSLLMVCICWACLSFWIYPVRFKASAATYRQLDEMYRRLGRLGREETAVLAVFALVAGLWILRPVLAQFATLPGLSDTVIAIGGALALFTLPLGTSGQRLLSWQDTARLPWGMLLMIGGGLSLAAAASSTGLGSALGTMLTPLGDFGLLALIAGIAVLVIFMTELNSNTATAATMVPVISALALKLDIDPLLLIMPLVLSVSCAFMLPVATIPNTAVYGTGLIKIPQMVRAGFALNLIGAALATAFGYLVIPVLLR